MFLKLGLGGGSFESLGVGEEIIVSRGRLEQGYCCSFWIGVDEVGRGFVVHVSYEVG
jgi:hypothetical protein